MANTAAQQGGDKEADFRNAPNASDSFVPVEYNKTYVAQAKIPGVSLYSSIITIRYGHALEHTLGEQKTHAHHGHFLSLALRLRNLSFGNSAQIATS